MSVNVKSLGASKTVKLGMIAKKSSVEKALKRALIKIQRSSSQSSFYGDKIMIIEDNKV